jgi:hypothetical protein
MHSYMQIRSTGTLQLYSLVCIVVLLIQQSICSIIASTKLSPDKLKVLLFRLCVHRRCYVIWEINIYIMARKI